MKVMFLHDENLVASSGVGRKVRAQFGEWERHGISVTSFGLRDKHRGRAPQGGFAKLIAHWGNVADLREHIRGSPPDLIYMRYIKWAPGFVGSLGSIPVVLEVNTNDRTEFFAAGMHHGIYNWFTRRMLLARVNAFVSVTSELLEASVLGAGAQPRLMIPNGYDFSSVRLDAKHREWSPRNPPTCVFVGTEGHPWHGVDRLLELAERLADWRFNIVGISPAYLGGKAPASPNVNFLGSLSGDQLAQVLLQSDIGFGSLALSRIGLRQACPLKSREYFAYGLPVIAAYDDPDVSSASPVSLRLRDTPWLPNESASMCRQFAASLQSINKGQVRDWAEARMSVALKEKQRAEFLISVAAASGR